MTAAYKLPSIRNIALGLFGLALSLCVLFAAAPKAQAASLTSAQVSSIVSLLQAFGAEQSVIENVRTVLSGGTVPSTAPSSSGGVTSPTTTPVPSATPTISLLGVEGQTYRIGERVNWNVQVSNALNGSSVCLVIVSDTAGWEGGFQGFGGSDGCFSINGNGTRTFTAALNAQRGFNFGPGRYHLRAYLVNDSGTYLKVNSGSFTVLSGTMALDVSPTSGNAPLTVSFNGNLGGVSAFGGVQAYFGDASAIATVCAAGSSCGAFNLSHTYTAPGTYTVRFYAVGEGDNRTLGTKTITVSGAVPATTKTPTTTPTTNVSTSESSAVNPTITATVSPWKFKNGGTLTLKWDIFAPEGYTLEIGIPALLKLRGDLPGNSPLYTSNILSPSKLNGGTGTLTGKSSGNSFSSIPSHGSLSFVTDYASNLLPVTGSVIFTLRDSVGKYVTQAVSGIFLTDPNVFDGPTGGVSGTTYTQLPSATPTIYGGAAGTDKVYVALTDSSGAVVFTSGVLTVSGGQWSVKVTGVPAGKYLIHVYDAAHDNTQLEAVGTLTVSATTVTNPNPEPTCKLYTDRRTYPYGDTIMVLWTSNYATSLSWVRDTSGKDNLTPPSEVPATTGSAYVKASVLGNPYLKLQVTGLGGTSYCTITIPVTSTSSYNNNAARNASMAAVIEAELNAINMAAAVLAAPYQIVTDNLAEIFYEIGLF